MLAIDLSCRLAHFTLEVAVECPYPVTAVFGPSGAGKTSLLNMVAGLRRPDAGEIRIDGEVLFSSSSGIDLAPEQRRIGYVFQDDLLFPHLTVERNLRYGYELLAPEQRRFDPERVVELLEIGPLLERRPRFLSGGERQRVALARALANDPPLLLADEPTAGLDRGGAARLLGDLDGLVREQGKTLVMVTHRPDEVPGAARELRLSPGVAAEVVGP